MAKQVGKSSLAGKLGEAGKKAFEQHKADETKFSGGGSLPEGIENGVAQLVECKFGQYEKGPFKGEFFFYAAGTVHQPKTHNGMRIEGQRTSIIEPMCNSPKKSRKTVDEHLAWVLNEMRKLGVVTTDISFDDLESIAASLKESAPFFKFRTWKGDKQTEGEYKDVEPRVQEQWGGVIEYTPEEGSDVQDNTAAAPEPEADAAGDDATPPDDEVTAEAAGEDDELNTLAAAAEEGDKKARKELTAKATEAGVSEEDIKDADDWAAVVTLIKQHTEEGGDETPPFVPEKTNVFLYKPKTNNPATKKPFKEAVECEVVEVSKKNETVTLMLLDDRKTKYEKVAWSELAELPA